MSDVRMRLVPVEATDEMLSEFWRETDCDWGSGIHHIGGATYAAMLSAAPAPSDAQIDALCIAYEATHKHAITWWWEQNANGDWTVDRHDAEGYREADRARMRAFLAALEGKS